MWFLSLLWGCGSDHFLTYGKVQNEIEYVYVQDVFIEGSDDTGSNEPIWVDSFVQPSTSNGVDIIWIIDGSGSMNNDQQMILQGISDMMQNLPLLNWRLMIISMTPSENVSSQSFPLLPGDDHSDAIVMMSQNVQGNYEYGFESLRQFIEDNQFAQQWLRDDAALLTVFVSDENEGSISEFPTAGSFESWLRNQREHVFVSSIVNVDPEIAECTVRPLDVGQRYIDLTNAFNGQIIDICSEDWSQGVADASTQVQPREWLVLSRVPVNDQEIYMFVDGQPWHDWTYDATENKIIFNVIPPEESLVEIAYYY
tara:strand:+ start:927 stop:1859 length:933 start_codon:yes stop_codon:yes gene_type:complete